MFDETEKALGPVDILVNNAAHWEADTFIPGDETLRNKMVEMWTARPARMTADVANVVIFLSSEQAGWITGQKFFVGGGHGV